MNNSALLPEGCNEGEITQRGDELHTLYAGCAGAADRCRISLHHPLTWRVHSNLRCTACLHIFNGVAWVERRWVVARSERMCSHISSEYSKF